MNTRNRNKLKIRYWWLLMAFSMIYSLSVYSQGANGKNTVYLIGQLTNNLNGAPIKNKEVIVLSDSTYNPNFLYQNKLLTDNEGYYYDTISTDLNKGGFIVYTYDYLNTYHDTTVYFRFTWSEENVLFPNFVLPVEPPSITYQANFYYQRNPSGLNNSEYQFYDLTNSEDIISWQWNFGNGNFSSEPNPLHEYIENGIYRVKLTVLIQPTPYSIPYESSMVKIINVTVKDYFSFGGHVKAGYFPIDIGEAFLYKIDDNNLELIDTAVFNDTLGYYLFYQVIEGQYIVKADLHPESELFNQFMTTYYSNKPLWTEADTVFHYSNFWDYNIDLIPVVQTNAGPGLASGIIMYGTELKNIPATNVEILLFNENNEPLICCHSNDDGEFDFCDLELGSYWVYPEVTGKYTYPLFITLNENNIEIINITITISSYTVNGSVNAIDENEWLNNISNPYPNPASEAINIELQLPENSDVHFSIYNSTGQSIGQMDEQLTSGANIVNIDISMLPEGIYYLMVSDKEKRLTKKFIKK